MYFLLQRDGYAEEKEKTHRQNGLEVLRIETVNGNSVCRRDTSFNRDLHRRRFFSVAAFVMRCASYMRERQLRGELTTTRKFFLQPRHSVIIRDKQCVSTN